MSIPIGIPELNAALAQCAAQILCRAHGASLDSNRPSQIDQKPRPELPRVPVID